LAQVFFLASPSRPVALQASRSHLVFDTWWECCTVVDRLRRDMADDDGGEFADDLAGDLIGELPAEGMIDEPVEDMSDPVDILLAMTEDPTGGKARPLDFVRAKFKTLKSENKRLSARVQELEQTLSIVQTAQEWTMGKGMTQEQAEKMREIKQLLEQAKQARADMQAFSANSKAAMYEKLRAAKVTLRREREEKREMKERLLHAFDRARVIKEQHEQQQQQQEKERLEWQTQVQTLKDQHKRAILRLQGEGAVMQADKQEQYAYFGEQVAQDLFSLQQHMRTLRGKTVDSIMIDEEEAPLVDDAPEEPFQPGEEGDEGEYPDADEGEDEGEEY